MEQDTRAKLESALGFKLTSTERDILAHIEREVEKLGYGHLEPIKRTKTYDILESLGTKPIMV